MKPFALVVFLACAAGLIGSGLLVQHTAELGLDVRYLDAAWAARLYRDEIPFALRADTVRRPGAEGEEPFTRVVLEHPGAVVVLALDEQDRVLCLRQYRHPARMRMLELPAGLLDVEGEDPQRAAARVEPDRLAGLTTGAGGDTVYLSAIDRDGNIVSLIQSIFQGFGSGLVAPGTGFALQNRGALFTLEPGHPNELAPGKRPLHTIIPGFMRKDDVRIGFGIMGGFNQAQAHAQFVANVVDFGLDIQEAIEAGRFTKPTFAGLDVSVEETIPAESRRGLAARGHEVLTVPARTHAFGYGQAVMSDGTGVHYGASEPRHDGAAIPEPAPFPAA